MKEDWTIGRKGIYKEYLVLRIPFQVKKELKQLAKRKRLSVSDLVRLSIEKLLNEETQK
jgi:antitoxin component of RelBE/YafQ-DinJ toxin-antitoxin module